MLILNSNFKAPPDMDPECVKICNAMNAIPGITTFESCCGHGEDTFRIFFNVEDKEGLFFLTRCADHRYFRHWWNITLSVSDIITNETGLPLTYLLSSTDKDESVYRQANDMVDNLNIHLNKTAFINHFSINLDRFQTFNYL